MIKLLPFVLVALLVVYSHRLALITMCDLLIRRVRRQPEVHAPRARVQRSRGPRRSKRKHFAPSQGYGLASVTFPFACGRSRKLCALAAVLIVVAFGCAALVHKSAVATCGFDRAALVHKSAVAACDEPGCIDGATFARPRDVVDTAADEFRSPSTNRSHVFFCKSTRKASDEKVTIGTSLFKMQTRCSPSSATRASTAATRRPSRGTCSWRLARRARRSVVRRRIYRHELDRRADRGRAPQRPPDQHEASDLLFMNAAGMLAAGTARPTRSAWTRSA